MVSWKRASLEQMGKVGGSQKFTSSALTHLAFRLKQLTLWSVAGFHRVCCLIKAVHLCYLRQFAN